MAKRCLLRAIPSISSRVQVRTYSQRPQTADTNKHDSGILGILRKIETDIKELKDLHKKTREEISAIRDEVTIISSLKVVPVIRKTSPARFQSGERVGQIKDPLASWIGSDIEPAADVITDVSMCRRGLMHDTETFTSLYGMDWEAARELIGHPHMVSAMNKRANVLYVTASTEWTKEREFDQLRRWTQTATPEELVDFKKDVRGVTYPKKLFLNIMHSS